jgi:L-fuculose-phosphate aldolase
MDIRERMAAICRMAYDRRLLDSAGGNLTVRERGSIYMSPRYAGSRRQWQLSAEDFLVVDGDGTVLAGSGERSRETAVHLAAYRAFPTAGCVFHAHPVNVMIFVSAGVPLASPSEQTDKYGEIGFCEWAPAHSEALATNVVHALRPLEVEIQSHPIATLVPRHGIFIVGADLDSAYDALERIDRAARIAVLSRLIAR